MEAASNQGIRAVDTEFIVIHDDDDSWEPDFLRDMTAFLTHPRARAAGFDGAICRAMRISERLEGASIVQLARETYMPWVSEVPLAQMAVGNFFAPISFLYRRQVYDAIGGYDETLPVLGDWKFNLHFLSRTNIGLLDRCLSNYHHRDTPTLPGYGNSVTSARALHAQYFSVVTNAVLRDPASPPGLISAIAQAHVQRVLEHRLNLLSVRSAQPQETPSPLLRAPPDSRLPDADIAFIRRSVRAFLSRNPLLRPAAPMVAACAALVATSALRHRLLPVFLPAIPSAPDFDHIAYLGQHPDLWATRFNGPGEWLPYHHWLLNAPRTARPTMPVAPSDRNI